MPDAPKTSSVQPFSPPGRFDPLPADHPSIGRPCAVCGVPLAAGDRVTLVNPTPADDDEAAKAAAGRAHNARVQVAHETPCAYPEVYAWREGNRIRHQDGRGYGDQVQSNQIEDHILAALDRLDDPATRDMAKESIVFALATLALRAAEQDARDEELELQPSPNTSSGRTDG